MKIRTYPCYCPAGRERPPLSESHAANLKGLEPMAEPWVSVEEVAKHLGVAKDSVYRWIERKRLPAHRMGRLWKFKVSEVDEWVLQGGARSNQESSNEQR